jgi:hypothetical protein
MVCGAGTGPRRITLAPQKKPLLPGIAGGLVIAIGTILARMWIRGISFKDSLVSPFGIAALICFPIADVLAFYYDLKRKQEKKAQEQKEQK